MTFSRLGLCCGLLLISGASFAADEPFFEGTVFGGYQFGGTFTNADDDTDRKLKSAPVFGFTVNLKSTDTGYYELTYSRQSSSLSGIAPLDMTVEYLHIGGSLDFGQEGKRTIPYFLITVGGTRFTPDSKDLETETAFSLSMGGGLKIPFSQHIALRLEGRAYATILDAHSIIFCQSGADQSTCHIRVHGGSFIQAQGTAGIMFRF
jgi:opacity protein-like surface antigen